jgi:hypothetical protein
LTPILLGLLGLGLFGAANSEVRRFERAASLDFAGMLQGEGKRVEVRAKVGPEGIFGDVHAVHIRADHFAIDGLPLFTEPNRSTKGHVRSLRLELEDFVLAGLSVRRLRAEIPDCRFDFSLALRRRQMRISRSGVGTGEVEIGEKDLERYVLVKHPEIKRCQLRIDRDKILVDGFVQTPLIASEFFLVARLEPAEGTKLVLAYPRLLLGGQPASEAMRTVLLKALNPVIDLDRDLKLFGAVQVQRLVLRDGTLRAVGAVRLPEKPEPPAP